MVGQARGLKRPRIAPELQVRLPPGQFLTERWPVLHAGVVPSFDPATWQFRVFGLVERELRYSWEEFLGLPRTTVGGDLHCVSRWSKLDNTWEGVAAREVIERAGVRAKARFVLLHAEGGYTANVPLAVFAAEDVVLALKHDGADLTPEHGHPLRCVIPSRYAWKSTKWLRGVEFLADDRPGFWEGYGYSSSADPWREERFGEE